MLRRLRRLTGSDEGLSLIELLVSMAVMLVVGSIFTTGILQVYRSSTATEAESIAQGQLSPALLRLDAAVRYAYFIGTAHDQSVPGMGTVPYVEYLTVTRDTTANAYVKRCVQLRLAGTGPGALQLQTRWWNQGSSAVQPSAWVPLASGLALVQNAAPFVRVEPTQNVKHQLLTIRLAARSGTTTRSSVVTFTALNSDRSTAFDTATGNPVAVTTEPCYVTGARS